MDDLFNAIKSGNVEDVERILDASPTLVNKADIRGFTPLIMATYVGQMAVVQLLIDKGADVNLKGAQGNTALMGVCFKGSVEMAQLLISAGADIDMQNDTGMKAIDFAKQYDQQAILQLLKK